MAAKRATYHHHDLDNALVAAAQKLIEEHGVAGFSLREAARAVGVDPAACYRHFRDKDALLDEIARRGFTRLAARMEAAIARLRSPATRLRALATAYVAFALDEPATFRTMFGTTGTDARDPRRRGDYARSPFEILAATVMIWRPEAGPEVPLALWAAVHGVAALSIEHALRDQPALPLAELTIDAMIAGLDR